MNPAEMQDFFVYNLVFILNVDYEHIGYQNR